MACSCCEIRRELDGYDTCEIPFDRVDHVSGESPRLYQNLTVKLSPYLGDDAAFVRVRCRQRMSRDFPGRNGPAISAVGHPLNDPGVVQSYLNLGLPHASLHNKHELRGRRVVYRGAYDRSSQLDTPMVASLGGSVILVLPVPQW